MNYLVILLLTVLAVSVFSSGMETRSKVESGPGMEVKTKVETQKTVTDTHPRVRRWGYYGGMGGVRHPRYLRQLPYGSTYGNVQYGSGLSAGNGWNGGVVGSARGFGFGTGSDGYH
uniref:Secreted protein n=1 Tax=Caenorhabditis tropicalis TaxID=1561998 RepID=A0A1I7T6Y8_9PELO